MYLGDRCALWDYIRSNNGIVQGFRSLAEGPEVESSIPSSASLTGAGLDDL